MHDVDDEDGERATVTHEEQGVQNNRTHNGRRNPWTSLLSLLSLFFSLNPKLTSIHFPPRAEICDDIRR